MTTRAPLACSLVLLLAACGGADPERAGASRAAIVGGTPSTSSTDAIVLIEIGTEGSCTGTFVAPNLVITARHCLQNIDESSECGTFTTSFAPSSIAIRVGANGATTAAHGKQIFVEAPQTSGCGHDIGLLLLDRDVTGAALAPVRTTKLAVGEATWTVGYGEDGYGKLTNGRYEKTGLVVDAVGPAQYTYETRQNQAIPVTVPAGEIATGESTCFGDSGGPLLDAKGNVVGVTSRGVDDSCVDRPSIYSDTASHVALIQAAAQASGHAVGEGAQTTDPPPEAPDGGGATHDGGAEDDGADDATAEPPTKRSSRAATMGPASSGCAASGRAADASLAVVLALVAAGALASRRRAR